MGGAKFLGFLLVVSAASAAASCKTACEPKTIDRAVAFLKAHQSCEVDADCVVVSDHCGELPGGFCGQLVLSREGVSSSEWASIDAELEDCSAEECTQCLAAVVPACTDGSCNGP